MLSIFLPIFASLCSSQITLERHDQTDTSSIPDELLDFNISWNLGEKTFSGNISIANTAHGYYNDSIYLLGGIGQMKQYDEGQVSSKIHTFNMETREFDIEHDFFHELGFAFELWSTPTIILGDFLYFAPTKCNYMKNNSHTTSSWCYKNESAEEHDEEFKFFKYNLIANKFTRLANLPRGSGMNTFCAATNTSSNRTLLQHINKYIYSVGGVTTSWWPILDTLYRYDTENDEWELMNAHLNIPRQSTSCIIYDEILYVIGGLTIGPVITDSIEKYYIGYDHLGFQLIDTTYLITGLNQINLLLYNLEEYDYDIILLLGGWTWYTEDSKTDYVQILDPYTEQIIYYQNITIPDTLSGFVTGIDDYNNIFIVGGINYGDTLDIYYYGCINTNYHNPLCSHSADDDDDDDDNDEYLAFFEYDFVDWNVFTIIIVFISLIVLICIFLSYCHAYYQCDVFTPICGLNDSISTISITLFFIHIHNFLFDILFCAYLMLHRFYALSVISIFALIITWISSFLVFNYHKKYWIVMNICTHYWLLSRQSFLYKLSILTGNFFSAVELCSSKAFGIERFTMSLTQHQLYSFRTHKLITLAVTENIPQLIIASIYLNYSINANIGISVMSLTSLVVNVITIVSDIVLFIVRLIDSKYSSINSIYCQLTVNMSSLKEQKKCMPHIKLHRKLRESLAIIFQVYRKAVEIYHVIPVVEGNGNYGFYVAFTVSILNDSNDGNDDNEIEKILKLLKESINNRSINAVFEKAWDVGNDNAKIWTVKIDKFNKIDWKSATPTMMEEMMTNQQEPTDGVEGNNIDQDNETVKDGKEIQLTQQQEKQTDDVDDYIIYEEEDLEL